MKNILENINLKNILKSKKFYIITFSLIIFIWFVVLFLYILDGFNSSQELTKDFVDYPTPISSEETIDNHIIVTIKKVGDPILPIVDLWSGRLLNNFLPSSFLLKEDGNVLFLGSNHLQLYDHKTGKFNLIYCDLFDKKITFLDNKIFFPYLDIVFDLNKKSLYKINRKKINHYLNINEIKTTLEIQKKISGLELNGNNKNELINHNLIFKYCSLNLFLDPDICNKENLKFDPVYFSIIPLDENKILLIGGKSKKGKALNTIKLYDNKNKKTTLLGYMKCARIQASSILMKNNKVLITSGESYDKINIDLNVSIAEVFDLQTGKSKIVKNNFTNSDMGNYKLLLLMDGNVLIYGTSNALYDYKTNTIYPIRTLPEIRDQNAIVLKNGQVLISGGSGINDVIPAEPRIYNFQLAQLVTINIK